MKWKSKGMLKYKVITNPYGVIKAVIFDGEIIKTYSNGVIVRPLKKQYKRGFAQAEYVANNNIINN